jgi:GrpB-like predicted nucleotidyltransferase (UPF0157 family)
LVIVLAEYDPQWPALFERQANRIEAALGERALNVQHVGSTSIPGLMAKPVLDILLVVADSADEQQYEPALQSAGYRLHLREPEWYEHRLFRAPDTEINLHVLSSGCPEIDRMLALRNRLRGNDADRELYARAKSALAAREWRDIDEYARAKTAVIDEILARAMSVAS